MKNGAKTRGALLVLCACLLGGAGCVSFDAAEARRGQTEAFSGELARLEEEWLARPLSLAECVAIAMTNNYEVRKADLDAQLGRFSRDMAFSAFLPQVSASATRVDYDRDPVLNSQRFTSGGVDVGMAILMPSTWFLYDEARHGRAAADLAAGYVRQGVALQTTAAFYEVLVQEKLVAAAERQLVAARETAGRVEGLAREGFARPWERDQARYLVEAREAQLGAARRALDVKRGDLLRAMGLSPLAGIVLVPPEEEDLPPPESLEALVLRALECNPRLPIADRQVVMKESAVRRAFCEFLPNLSVFGQWSFTGNKVMNPPSHNFDWGFKGTWDLFNGFRSVADLRAAKAERRQAELARENTFLSVMAGVVSARAAVEDAAAGAAVARRAWEVASGKAEDLMARAKEGLDPVSDALDAEAARDAAEAEMLRASYTERVARANLEFAVGENNIEKLESRFADIEKREE
ncbi:MAG: TolC family protein [Kiritimatiellae bacterium]|nr:TolC family protein [Kiritimatiellia bacterium]